MKLFSTTIFLFLASVACAQLIKWSEHKLEPIGVSMAMTRLNGKQAVRVVKDSTIKEVDEPTFVRLQEVEFTNGTIEVMVLSRLLKNASSMARGFIGVAFRINENHTAFECFYLRPTNGRADNQVRRNHSVQYFSFPDFKFDRLRKEAPEAYESYADMGLDEWIKIRIDVNEQQAKLFLQNQQQPTLIINDLKHGSAGSGAIGLWVDVGTEGYFSDLKITKR